MKVITEIKAEGLGHQIVTLWKHETEISGHDVNKYVQDVQKSAIKHGLTVDPNKASL